MRSKRPLALAAVIAVLSVLTGCGSSGGSGHSKVTATAYARSFCAAIKPFAQDIVSRAGTLNLAHIKTPAQGKQAIVGYLTAIESDTGTALTKLQSAGSPDVTNGSRIAGAVVSAFSQLRSAMSSAVTEAQGLPTSSASALKNSSLALDNHIRSSLGSVGQNLSTSALKNPQLEKAVAADPTCKALGAA